jgi:hypothetical protein
MAAKAYLPLLAGLFFMLNASAHAGGIADSRITAEVILDGMTHYEADQGIKDYKVDILEITAEPRLPDEMEAYLQAWLQDYRLDIFEITGFVGSQQTSQRVKQFYFMAPNVGLTMAGDEPVSFSNDATFMALLLEKELVREKDAPLRGEECYKVLATPREPPYKSYTTTYYIAKSDYRKLRIISHRTEMEYGLVRYEMDFYYRDVPCNDGRCLLLSCSKVMGYSDKNEVFMERINIFHDYEFDIGLTQKFFEGILEDYNYYFSKGS